MLLDNVTLSDYSNDELKQFIDEAQFVINNRNKKEVEDKIKQFIKLFHEIDKSIDFVAEDENGASFSVHDVQYDPEHFYPDVTFSISYL